MADDPAPSRGLMVISAARSTVAASSGVSYTSVIRSTGRPAAIVIQQNGGGKMKACCRGSTTFLRPPTAEAPSVPLATFQLLLRSVPAVQVGDNPVQPGAQPLSVR